MRTANGHPVITVLASHKGEASAGEHAHGNGHCVTLIQEGDSEIDLSAQKNATPNRYYMHSTMRNVLSSRNRIYERLVILQVDKTQFRRKD